MALPQDLHDALIGGTIRWTFDGDWSAELGWAGGFTARGRGTSAEEVAVWQVTEATWKEGRGFTAGADYGVLQALHDAEISGEVSWWRPSEGFLATIASGEPRHFADWPTATAWLRAQTISE